MTTARSDAIRSVRRIALSSTVLAVAGCAIAFSYDDYERENASSIDGGGKAGKGGGGGVSGGVFGGNGGGGKGGTPSSGGSPGGSAGAATGGVAGSGGTTGGAAGAPSGGSGGATGGAGGSAGMPAGGGGGSGGTCSCPPNDTCKSYSGCPPCTLIPAGMGTACGSACFNGSLTSSFCDGSGACVAQGPTSCNGFICASGTACMTTCGSHSECVPGFQCVGDDCFACTTCNKNLTTPVSGPAWCAGDSASLWNNFKFCCNQQCLTDCGSNLCSTSPSPPTSACIQCLQTKCPQTYFPCSSDNKAE